MGKRVDKIKTPVSEYEMGLAMIKGWEKLFGERPSKEQVSLLMAQNALETGHRKSMWNYNVGNITTNGKDPYDYFDTLPTNEQIAPGKWKKMNLKYRAYPNLEAGVLDYLKFLSQNSRYASAWRHILNPDPVNFSKKLKEANYYTANEAPYTKTLKSLFEKFVSSKPSKKNIVNKPKPPIIKDEELGKQLEAEASLDVFSKLDKVLDVYLHNASLFN